MSAFLELSGLSVRLGKRDVLRDLRGTLSGRSIGLLGPNGAGKTTLLHTLLGFFPPSAGSARLAGFDVVRQSRDVRRAVGYMPENDAFIAGISGVRYVAQFAELSGLPPAQALERAHEALFSVGLGEVRYRTLETYSLGMKQLVKLAQAIAHGPRVLFLDEPTNGLDPPGRQRMLRFIQEIRDSGEIRIILSSHLLRDVEECCDEVLILKDGRVAALCNLEAERKANRRLIELETAGGNGSFTDALAGLGCSVAPGIRRRVKVLLPEGVGPRDLYRLASEQGVQLRHLTYQRDSLEEIFLRAMEG
ncbi:MAG: ABC transporter ATP-binding protein [Acidobacteria bacterium]|nr:ABC transporter ATP-binding protein [Acidobacteriota bacterium]MCG3191053.1 Vitamin B12 import ATP-binding protein BtuD [Thermoanaerobaculia bacterium]